MPYCYYFPALRYRGLLAPLTALLLAAAPLAAQAQSGSVGIGTTAPNASAALEIRSTSQGLLLPRLTLAQRDALTASTTAPPVAGLVIYQSDNTPGLYAYDGTAWVRLGGDNLGNHMATQNLDLADKTLVGNGGTDGLTIAANGNVGLGTTTAQPATQRLDVRGNVRLGDNGGQAAGTGQAIEWVGPGVSSDPVGIYRHNPAVDQSELRVVVGDVGDPSDKFVVGRMPSTSSEGGLPTGTFTPAFSVGADGTVNVNGLAGTGTRLLAADPDGNLTATATTGTEGDNLGDHVATQNINLNGNKLVGGTTDRAIRGGLALNGNGLLTVGAARVHTDSTTRYGVRLLNMDQDVVITSDQGKGNTTPAVTGAGDRLMWLSYYSAFRAGGVTDDRWNQTANSVSAIGQYSAAFGLDNQASSLYSSAFGWNNLLRNSEGTMVMGNNNNIVQSFYGMVMGGRNSPKGWYNFVGGYQNKIRGSTLANYSPTVGGFVPDWPPSFSFGQGCYSRSSRGNTYTMGYYARTGGFYGSFVFADMSPINDGSPIDRMQDSVYSTRTNQMTMRFAGGYRFFTTVATRTDPSGLSALGTPIGAELTPGSNSWTFMSDSTKKERRVLADGNLFLARINRMRLGSWNYIGQSADTMRHYGPMAQDFFAAFGHDGVGRSGNKISINQADFDGVNLIAIQALYRRVLLLEAENAQQQLLLLQLQAAAGPAAGASLTPAAEVAELRRQQAALQARAAQADADHASLLTLQAQVARLLGADAQARQEPAPAR
ncbi:tail fiber domain-containing protein [Hymenobacter guriensis]|uniref:Tail fiber domain-containing protein n=1 Tax=Hymenobacter guriensis TaxID=2793065 RepID=A0ABS0L3T3_9BACT|nr:tail fiber domain-containing protein [Hymenobacter guriensis]MBG8554800.1 tail fiber domain-containing protein [Hymenobacter guriensis]